MATGFLRYTPGVEEVEPNFDASVQRVLDQMSAHMRASLQVEGIGRVVRDAHAKGYGLARAEFEILDGLPAEYAQGIYTRPGKHQAAVRFSNGLNHTGADRLLGAVVGIGVKIFDIGGQTLLEDEPDARTFDYALINYPTFFVNSVGHYIFIQSLFAQIGMMPPPDETPEEKRRKLHQFLHAWVTGNGTLAPEDWAWEELGSLLPLTQLKRINLLLSTYWTMGAVRHGDYIAKVRVAPVREFADKVEIRSLDPNAQAEVFRPALVSELRERPYEFDVQVQLCTDLANMPVERVTVRWPESLSPYVTVAKLRLPRQDIGGADNFEPMDAISVTPWRVTEAHRPLGNIMRVRKEAYRQSSILRHELNRQVRGEPGNLEDLFTNSAAVSA